MLPVLRWAAVRGFQLFHQYVERDILLLPLFWTYLHAVSRSMGNAMFPHGWLCLYQFFSFSHMTVFTEASTEPEGLPTPLFTAIMYSVLRVRKLENVWRAGSMERWCLLATPLEGKSEWMKFKTIASRSGAVFMSSRFLPQSRLSSICRLSWKKSACMRCISDCLVGLNVCKVIHSFFNIDAA